MKRLSTLFALSALAIASFSACQSNVQTPPAEADYTNSALTQDEHKARLENIGLDLMDYYQDLGNKIKPIIWTLLDLEDYNKHAGEYVYNFNQSLKTLDIYGIIGAATRASEQMIVDLSGNESQLNGYIISYDKSGRQEITENGRPRTFEIKWDDSHATFEWGKNKGQYTLIDKASDTEYLVEVPAFIKLTLTIGGIEHLYIHLEPNVTDTYTYAPNISIRLRGGYEITSTLDASSEKVSGNFSLKRDGKMITSATAATDIKDLTNTENWYDEEDGEYDNLDSYFFNNICESYFKLDLLSLSIIGGGDMTDALRRLNECYDLYPYQEDGGKLRTEKECEILNDSLKVIAVYTDTKQIIAELLFEPISEWGVDDSSYWIGFTLVFGDGSKVAIQDYINEDNFRYFFERYVDIFGE